mgnify:CR=1 FL=1
MFATFAGIAPGPAAILANQDRRSATTAGHCIARHNDMALLRSEDGLNGHVVETMLGHDQSRFGPRRTVVGGFDIIQVRSPVQSLASWVIIERAAQTACLGQPLIYLDYAATSQKPQQVLEALQRYYAHDNANVHRGAHQLSARATEGFEAARQTVAATFSGLTRTPRRRTLVAWTVASTIMGVAT